MKRLTGLVFLAAFLMAVSLTHSYAQVVAPEELGLTSRYVTLDTGINMHYVERGRGKGHVIIFLHGYTDSWRSFERNLPLISDKFHIYALDQRGHGDSSRPACCYTQGDFSADVAAFMDALKIKKATIVGHSMGSFIAHKFAVEHPRRVRRLVLIGGSPTMAGNEVVAGLNEFVQTLADPVPPQFVRDFQASTFVNPIPPEFLDTAVSESLKLPASVWKQTLAGMVAEDHSAELGEIKAPTLILWGDNDGIFSLQDQLALDTLIPNSIFKRYSAAILPPGSLDGGHGLHVEFPQHIVGDIEAFAR
ncbi:MAG TPA: alpha/beta hydrolase [Pyrinomonadaceae bacterium]|nr:alpha/beta hydrolase [Pyrinomonadaceae bacterium]